MEEKKSSVLTTFIGGPQRHFTPLYIVAGIFIVAELILTVGVVLTSGYAQGALIFLMAFILITPTVGLLLILWSRPQNLYSPSEYGQPVSAQEFIGALRGNITAEVKNQEDSKHEQNAAETQEGESQSVGSSGASPSELPGLSASGMRSALEWEKELFIELNSDEPDFSRAEESFQRFQADELDPVKRLRNETVYWYLRQNKGDEQAIEMLGSMPEKAKGFPEVVPEIYNFLGVAFTNIDGWSQALDSFQRAFETAQSELQKALAVKWISRVQLRLGREQDALTTSLNALSTTTDRVALSMCYSSLAQYYEKQKQPHLRAMALEKSLEYDANDAEVRFQTAMAYSDADLHELSMLHYRTILRTSPRYPYALNNLGVQYSRLDMPTLAVSTFLESMKQENTLSAANLANIYTDAGLVADAQRVLDKALTMEDVHKNVHSSMGRVKDHVNLPRG